MSKPLIFTLIAIGLLALAAGFFLLLKKQFSQPTNRFEKRIGRLLLQFAKENDFLCLNHLSIKVDDFFVYAPSILIGNKYFYYIDPLLAKGMISGKDIDRKWVLSNAGEMKHFDNPIKKNDLIIQVIADLVKIDVEDFINICVFSASAKMEILV